VIASIGYVFESFGAIVAPAAAGFLSALVIVLSVPGELAFAIWLVAKGVNEEKWATLAGMVQS
jgi:hypothetical protein